MIDSIKTINLDVSVLKTENEVHNYIPSQLQKFYPEPDKLLYDYVIKSNRGKKSALVSYIHKDKVENREITHPILLFKKVLQKDGNYIVVFSNTVLEVCINDKVIVSTKTSVMNPAYLKAVIDSKNIVICDSKNRQEVESLYNKKIVSLEGLYKRCDLKLFRPKRKSYIKQIIGLLLITLTAVVVLNVSSRYNSVLNEYEIIKKDYETKLISNNNSQESQIEYDELLEELFIIQSQIEPDLYKIFYELSVNASGYKIMDINYSNRYIRINCLTPNGISLVKKLNKSEYLDLIQNSSINRDGLEVSNISGDIICP